ncbi:hypothetical protein P5V15_001422 [Pogonomyrmex californicus]
MEEMPRVFVGILREGVKNQEILFFKALLMGETVFFKLDTGSEVTLVSSKFVGRKGKRFSAKEENLKYPTEERVPISFKMFAKIKLGRFNLELLNFVADIGEDCILDADFFSRIGMQTIIEFFLRGGHREGFCRRIKQEDEAVPAELEEFFDNNSRELEES